MRKLLNIKQITYIYLLILLLGTVLPLNSVSSPLNDNYTLHIRWDYLLHALVYIPLPVLLGLYLKRRSTEQSEPQIGKYRLWIQVVFFSLFITALFEILQLLIPYRAFNINDLMANGVGAIIGLMLIPILWKSFSRV